VCDNTFATPLLQQPLDLGVDVVVHSATKYLSGHSDVLLGVAVTQRADLYTALQRRRLVHGGIAGPMEAWLALRGLRTLHVRFERQCANAVEIARRAEGHPAVDRVRYPGFGAMVSIEVRGGAAAADAVATGCRLWLDATSLGGVESLIERRRKYAAESPRVPEALLRLSVGIEDVDDLWRDLSQALDAATG
jgi:cystathionine gamma-synthase